jgi:hypothetical protein
MLDLQSLSAEERQIEVVLQPIAQVRVGIRHAELVAQSSSEQPIAAETEIEERGDRARRLIGSRWGVKWSDKAACVLAAPLLHSRMRTCSDAPCVPSGACGRIRMAAAP